MLRLTERGRKAHAYSYKDADKMSAPISKEYKNNAMYTRTRAEEIIACKNFEELCLIVNEVDTLKDILPEVKAIDGHSKTFEELVKFLDEVTEHINFKETDETKNGYTTRYDTRQVGQYVYKNKDTNTDVYKESLLDKFHKWVSLLYYQLKDLKEDFIENENIVTPVSACETPWVLDER